VVKALVPNGSTERSRQRLKVLLGVRREEPEQACDEPSA